MAIITNNIELPQNHGHLIRPRLNTLLAQAINAPLTIVWGGMGCGKTRAVYDFTQQCDFPVAWLQFSNAEDHVSQFWQMFVHAIAKTNEPLAKEFRNLGFPDTQDKLNIYFEIRDRLQTNARRLYVLDDFHLVKDAAVLKYFEQVIFTLHGTLPLTSILLISRELPAMNISSLVVRNRVAKINEEDLNFTENELHQFLLQQELHSETGNLLQIYRDTAGWPFIINFVAQILKKTPGYMGYAKTAIRRDISQLIEAESWDTMSWKLKRFFLRLSLTTHRSMGLVNILADGDERLIAELNQQNVFVHYDRFINAYRIHQLFVDFLHTKQHLLSPDAIRNARKAIADWCVANDFIVDALFEYEKIGDYETIVSILFASPAKFLDDHGRQIVGIFDRAPEAIYDRVDLAAAMHIHLVLCSGQWRGKGLDLIRLYEAKYLRLPENDAFRNRMLGCIYYYWGLLRVLLCTEDDRYDFDTYFAKQYAYLKDFPINPKCWHQHFLGVWSCVMSTAKATAPQEFLKAVIRSSKYQQKSANGLTAGIGELCQSELLFYQGDMHAAKSCAIKAIEKAREHGQYEIVSRALFYLMRIAVFQGDYQQLELSLQEVERQIPDNKYSVSFLTYDIVLGWYYYILDQAEEMPDWLKGEFTPHSPTSPYENFGNYLKARYCYLTKQYAKLLAYLNKEEQRNVVLLERIELLAVKACLHLHMNNEKTACSILHAAYRLALPNGIVAPFIELGKDMRTLIYLAARCQDCTLPRPWLQSMQQRASAYSRNRTLMISEYKRTHEAYNKIPLSPRETVIFHDLRAGLSRSEIAAKHKLSINTVKLHINRIYSKLGARNRADMLRITTENNPM